MSTVYRTTATWTGFPGAPGYTKFSWDDLATDAARNAAGAAMRTFLLALAPYIPTGTSITVSPTVQGFDSATTTLVSEASMTTAPVVVSSSAVAANYAGGTGATIGWRTSSIFNGRRVQGRTFLVPLVGVFETNGTLQPTFISTMEAAGNVLLGGSAPKLCVWAHSWNNTVDPPVITGGERFPVTGNVVKDMASQLRSRRL